MRFSARCLSTLLLLTITLAPMGVAQLPTPTAGLNALPEVEFSRLSQRDPNPLGEKALALHPEQWKHGETEHFIYHFVNSYVVTPGVTGRDAALRRPAGRMSLLESADGAARRPYHCQDAEGVCTFSRLSLSRASSGLRKERMGQPSRPDITSVISPFAGWAS